MANFAFAPLVLPIMGFILAYIGFNLHEENNHMRIFFIFGSLLLLIPGVTSLVGIANAMSLNPSQYKLLLNSGWIVGMTFFLLVAYVSIMLIKDSFMSILKSYGLRTKA